MGVLALFAKHPISAEEDAMLDSLGSAVAFVVQQAAAEEAICLAKVEAERANAAKSTFLANMSHEMRTPLTAILGFTEMIGSSIECSTTCPEHQICPTRVQNKENIQVVQRSGKHLLDLINDILDLSKVEAGKLSLVSRPCSVPQVVADVASTMRVRAREKDLLLSVEYATELPEAVLADEARLRQMLLNLVANAVKFTEKGSVRLVTHFLPRRSEDMPVLRIEVIDTGIGISPDQIQRIWKPFEQGDPSTSRRFGGSGLGLPITRRLAEFMGGEVAVRSEPGQGSTFTLTIPVGLVEGTRMLEKPSEVVREAPPVGAPAWNARSLAGVRVLLAEDGVDILRLISTILRKAGAEVDCVENGAQAVERALQKSFDVILMDMQMPELDGYEATMLLRQRGYAGPILALTAHALAGDRERCLAAGCTDYQSKPIDRAELIAAVARYARAESASAPTAPVPEQADGPVIASTERIRSRYADDPDMAGILHEFIDALPERIRQMRQELAHGQFEPLRRQAHQLKGAGGCYGYPCLTEAAGQLEKAANDRDAEAAVLRMDRLASLCVAIQAGLDQPARSAEAQP